MQIGDRTFCTDGLYLGGAAFTKARPHLDRPAWVVRPAPVRVATAASHIDGSKAEWLGWLLRAVGVRVGKGVMISPEFAADMATPDMLTCEDGAIVDGLFHDHTFEDRVLKMDYVTIRQNAVLSRNAVRLYGSEVGAGSRVAPNSVVIKNEYLPPGEEYVGFPVRRVNRSRAERVLRTQPRFRRIPERSTSTLTAVFCCWM